MGKKIFVIASILTTIVACRPSTPSQYIQPAEMEDLLYDFHIARAMAVNEPGSYEEQTYRRTLYWRSALEKHHVSEAHFDSSLVYYYSRADRFAGMYKNVLTRLQDEALLLGATEGEIGKYASLDANGDTANIWNRLSTHILMPIPPYHYMPFEITGDTLFKRGDTFLMQFVSDFVVQSGGKDGLIYLAVDYPDTTIIRQTRFSYSGLNQIRMPSIAHKRPTRVKGYFYMGGSNESTTVLRLLFINSIQLIRFHSKDEIEASNQEGGVTSVGAAQRSSLTADGSGAAVGTRGQLLSVERGASPNRVVERIDSLKARH